MPDSARIPVSDVLVNDAPSPMTLPVCLTPEQSAWIRRQADERGVSPQQMVRYVLNQRMRGARDEKREPSDATARSASSTASTARPDATPGAAVATPGRRGGTTLIHLMRQSLKMARTQTEAERPQAETPPVSHCPPAEADASSEQDATSHRRAVQSLFDIARQAAV